MNKELLMKIIGLSCKRWRKSMDYKIEQISDETGYCQSSIYGFESGINDNTMIFLWYVVHGFNIDKDFVCVGNVLIKQGIRELFTEIMRCV